MGSSITPDMQRLVLQNRITRLKDSFSKACVVILTGREDAPETADRLLRELLDTRRELAELEQAMAAATDDNS